MMAETASLLRTLTFFIIPFQNTLTILSLLLIPEHPALRTKSEISPFLQRNDSFLPDIRESVKT